MSEHIKAWNGEYKRSIWKGHYSLEVLDSCCKTGRLLDAGCGSGKYAIPLGMRGFDVVAVDVSLNALKMAGKSIAGRKLDIGLLAANVYQMPFSDSSFDVIWCYGVLQHLLLKEREAAISEFRHLLRKGGLLFIEVLGEEDMRYGGSEVEPNTFSRKNGIIYHYFSKSELEELLGKFSCNIVESRKEKRFKGKSYTRHMISAVAEKP
ncbi:Ubiquinone biosynthesis O-methyltransferase [uncultured archaeon]|nr:Ubiquinone biosynthesis O-methyltransferase [uncultured archaeon]